MKFIRQSRSPHQRYHRSDMKSKKRPKKSNNNPVPTTRKSDRVVKVDDGQVDEKPFDYGGIPSRDLKKNLGCG